VLLFSVVVAWISWFCFVCALPVFFVCSLVVGFGVLFVLVLVVFACVLSRLWLSLVCFVSISDFGYCVLCARCLVCSGLLCMCVSSVLCCSLDVGFVVVC